jgi:hypothetical protein
MDGLAMFTRVPNDVGSAAQSGRRLTIPDSHDLVGLIYNKLAGSPEGRFRWLVKVELGKPRCACAQIVILRKSLWTSKRRLIVLTGDHDTQRTISGQYCLREDLVAAFSKWADPYGLIETHQVVRNRGSDYRFGCGR